MTRHYRTYFKGTVKWYRGSKWKWNIKYNTMQGDRNRLISSNTINTFQTIRYVRKSNNLKPPLWPNLVASVIRWQLQQAAYTQNNAKFPRLMSNIASEATKIFYSMQRKILHHSMPMEGLGWRQAISLDMRPSNGFTEVQYDVELQPEFLNMTWKT